MPYVGDAAEIAARAAVSRARPSRIKIAACATGLVGWILFMVSVRLVAGLLRVPGADNLPMYFHRGVKRFFNLKVSHAGELCRAAPVLYVCNHVSYLDVFVLGSVLPGSFIAKSEVAGWPVFGKLANFQNTLFFERNSRRAADQIKVMQGRLNDHKSLIFFPEGTSTTGDIVEPFRSSLFAAADMDPPVLIQPVSVAYTEYRGKPMSQAERDYYAWYLPMTFLGHFLNALGLGAAGVQVTFHEPVTIGDFESRKACAAHCEDAVRRGLLAGLAGQSQVVPKPGRTA
ncbi:MAG: 1-acyl-sn-glycerol-3-phosphate acyltransferase [Pseudomonadales bacterium]|nr:1-acyl-sn-glycerol-3-phosphate acyltransferase [Pseudomonadales bacterium]